MSAKAVASVKRAGERGHNPRGEWFEGRGILALNLVSSPGAARQP